jgi:CubicO group peptidase (beta-lactamase class C family)
MTCWRTIGILLLAALLISACSGINEGEVDSRRYRVPPSTDDGWEVASVADVGMKQEPLESMLTRLETLGEHRMHSIVIVKDGKLVFEQYYPGLKFNLGEYTGGTGYDMNDLHVLCSATKSITSLLLGIAIDRQLVQSVDQRVFDFFPEHADLLVSSPEKSAMTIRHLLTMMSGLEWDDESLPYSDPRNDLHRMFVSSDPIRFVLAKPLVHSPGVVFDYDKCDTNVIGEIVHRASDQRLDRFAQKYLFDKLGVTNLGWQIVRGDVIFCSGDLHLRPRDMAKVGLLVLNKGEWNGEQLASRSWCELSTAVHVNPGNYTAEFPWAQGYGFQWWQKTYYVGRQVCSSHFATGWGGQNIIVFPDLNAVVVTTAGNWYDPERISPFTLVSDFILPSILP